MFAQRPFLSERIASSGLPPLKGILLVVIRIGQPNLFHTDYCDTHGKRRTRQGPSSQRHTADTGANGGKQRARHMGAVGEKKSRGGYDLIDVSRWGGSGGVSVPSCRRRKSSNASGLGSQPTFIPRHTTFLSYIFGPIFRPDSPACIALPPMRAHEKAPGVFAPGAPRVRLLTACYPRNTTLALPA